MQQAPHRDTMRLHSTFVPDSAHELHDHGTALLLKGVECDEHGDIDEALSFYTAALTLLLRFIKHPHAQPEQRERVRSRVATVLDRAEAIRREQEGRVTVPESDEHDDEVDVPVDIVLQIPNAKAYVIDPDGHTELVGHDTLYLLKPRVAAEHGLHILQVGAFRFPLTPEVPCLASNPKFYVFGVPSRAFFGVMLPDSMSPGHVMALQGKLSLLCNLRLQRTEAYASKTYQADARKAVGDTPLHTEKFELVASSEAHATGQEAAGAQQGASDGGDSKVWQARMLHMGAKGVRKTGELLSRGIRWGGGMIASGIAAGGQRLKAVMPKAKEETKVDPRVKTVVETTAKITPYTVKVTKAAVDGLSWVARHVGQAAGSHLRSQHGGEGSKLAAAEKDPRFGAAKHLGSASLAGVCGVWDALGEAGLSILQATGGATEGVVRQRYGDDAGDTTHTGFEGGIGVVQTAYNWNRIGIKALAKASAKETGKCYVGLGKHKDTDGSQRDDAWGA